MERTIEAATPGDTVRAELETLWQEIDRSWQSKKTAAVELISEQGRSENQGDLVQVTRPDDQLELTPAGIPVSLRPFFQEYTLENLHPKRSAFTVIERTLAWGRAPDLRWLFATYRPQHLAEWVRQRGWYLLPRQRLKYWVCFFEITDYRRGERIWPH